jgi:hypothetical protein
VIVPPDGPTSHSSVPSLMPLPQSYSSPSSTLVVAVPRIIKLLLLPVA